MNVKYKSEYINSMFWLMYLMGVFQSHSRSHVLFLYLLVSNGCWAWILSLWSTFLQEIQETLNREEGVQWTERNRRAIWPLWVCLKLNQTPTPLWDIDPRWCFFTACISDTSRWGVGNVSCAQRPWEVCWSVFVGMFVWLCSSPLTGPAVMLASASGP